MTSRLARPFNRSQLHDLCSSSIPSATGVRHDAGRIRRLIESVARNLADPALARAALGVSADQRAQDPEYFGRVFESMVTRDMRSMVEARFGAAYHYRDNSGLEIDLIRDYDDRRWAAIEVKLDTARISEGERALLTLRGSRVDLQPGMTLTDPPQPLSCVITECWVKSCRGTPCVLERDWCWLRLAGRCGRDNGGSHPGWRRT